MEFRFKQFGLNHSLSTMKVGTDAVLLSAFAPRIDAGRVLDIGTGCGVIALIMAQLNPNAQVTAIDIDRESILQAEDNFCQSPFAARVQAVETSLQDFAAKESNHGKFDLIVSNPPYFVRSLNAPARRRNLARHNDSLPFAELAKAVFLLASPEARISIILPPEQMLQLQDLFLDFNIHKERQINIRSKADKPIERLVCSFCRKEQTPLCSDFLIHNSDNTHTSDYRSLVAELLL